MVQYSVELIVTSCWEDSSVTKDYLKGAPARTSTSRFLITRPSKVNIQCTSDISKPKYMCNTRQPNTHIRICIYANMRIQCMRVCLISTYELTYCSFFC